MNLLFQTEQALEETLAQLRGERGRRQQAEDERDALGKAIRDAAVKAGICRDAEALTGPQLILLCGDMARAAIPPEPVSVPDVDAVMTKAQEFASAWSLVGGRFDDGSMMSEAEERKNELRAMLAAAPHVDPCPGCKPETVCKKPDCGRLAAQQAGKPEQAEQPAPDIFSQLRSLAKQHGWNRVAAIARQIDEGTKECHKCHGSGLTHSCRCVHYDREKEQAAVRAAYPKAEQTKPCVKCGQTDHGQYGEYPCQECGLPTSWGSDARQHTPLQAAGPEDQVIYQSLADNYAKSQQPAQALTDEDIARMWFDCNQDLYAFARAIKARVKGGV